MMSRSGNKRKNVEVPPHRRSDVFIDHHLGADHQRVRTCPGRISKLVKHDTRTNRAIPCVQWTLIIERTLRVLLAEINLASIGTESIEGRWPDIVGTIGALSLRIF